MDRERGERERGVPWVSMLLTSKLTFFHCTTLKQWKASCCTPGPAPAYPPPLPAVLPPAPLADSPPREAVDAARLILRRDQTLQQVKMKICKKRKPWLTAVSKQRGYRKKKDAFMRNFSFFKRSFCAVLVQSLRTTDLFRFFLALNFDYKINILPHPSKQNPSMDTYYVVLPRQYPGMPFFYFIL